MLQNFNITVSLSFSRLVSFDEEMRQFVETVINELVTEHQNNVSLQIENHQWLKERGHLPLPSNKLTGPALQRLKDQLHKRIP